MLNKKNIYKKTKIRILIIFCLMIILFYVSKKNNSFNIVEHYTTFIAYADINALCYDSDMIFTCKIIDQDIQVIDDKVYTISSVEVEEILKTNSDIHSRLEILQLGGYLNNELHINMEGELLIENSKYLLFLKQIDNKIFLTNPVQSQIKIKNNNEIEYINLEVNNNLYDSISYYCELKKIVEESIK